MGRPLKGSVRLRNGKWLASVPRLNPEPRTPQRLECGGFATEDDAGAWVRVQIERIAAGLQPVKPDRPAKAKAVSPIAARAGEPGDRCPARFPDEESAHSSSALSPPSVSTTGETPSIPRSEREGEEGV